jgi:hypothetical protein
MKFNIWFASAKSITGTAAASAGKASEVFTVEEEVGSFASALGLLAAKSADKEV